MTRFHLAQVNIGRFRAPIEDPIMEGFRSQLDSINALADRTPGFLWRLQTEDGNATAVHAFEWDRAGSAGVLVNMSVWESVEALFEFVYKSRHVDFFRRRRAWFERFGRPYIALWWVPAATLPSAADARERLEYLEAHGPTPYAFTFKQRFAAPAAAA